MAADARLRMGDHPGAAPEVIRCAHGAKGRAERTVQTISLLTALADLLDHPLANGLRPDLVIERHERLPSVRPMRQRLMKRFGPS